MNITHKKITILFLVSMLFISLTSSLSAESPNEKKIQITEIKTLIDGNTKRKFLLEEINLFEGMEFDTYETFIVYLDEIRQDLINMRVFEIAEYAVEEKSSNEETRTFSVTLTVKDTWNIYPIPYPKYDSNTGFRLGLKFFYYNAFGTLMDFQLFTGLNIEKNNAKDYWEVSHWNISPELSSINIWNQDFSLSLSQSFSTIKKYETGVLQQEYTIHNSSISIGTRLYLPLDFYYTMSPRLIFSYRRQQLERDNNGDPLITDDDYEFANISWIHSIGFDNLDWRGNFREGFSANISNSLTGSYSLNNDVSFSLGLGTNVKAFWIINKFLNLSGQINGVYSYNSEMTGLGSYLRGVRDAFMYGYLGAFMSVDLNISVIDWDGVGEIQIRPFFEMGIVGKENSSFDLLNDFAYTTGADFVLYLDKLNSIQARATFGVDLSNTYKWNDWNKYEIDITSSLSY
ncbi:MAG: hypothetical protein PF518_17660 [Spirochaetaceae bacterium]|jgi:hypothetical protein|nr:hypothetical protein [Spirochaetaceae bacterium]